MAMSELDCRKALVGTGLAITLLLSANGLRKHSFGLAGTLFLVMKFFFSLLMLSLAESHNY